MAQSLIYSRRANNDILTIDDIRQRAPAVFAEDKAARLTARYASLKTADLLPVMADYGYHPVQAAQKRARKGDPAHTAHLLAFARQQDIEGDNGLRSEILAYNSHDGTTGVKLMAGAYRFVCSNGIVNGDGHNVSIRHSHKAMQDFEAMLRQIVEGIPAMMGTIESLRNRRLSNDEAWEFAKQAVELRWNYIDNVYEADDTAPGTYASGMTVKQSLKMHRSEDNFSDAWTVFNRVQENVLRGNVFINSVTKPHENHLSIRERKARPLASISEHVKVNAQMFDLIAA